MPEFTSQTIMVNEGSRSYGETIHKVILTRAEYDSLCDDIHRYIARCAELEKRLEQIREVLK